MKQPLDQLIQRFEQIVQQLKIIEGVFSSTSETCSHRSLADWKSIISREADSFNSRPSKHLPDRLFQVDEDGSKE
jgi:hypothetical protein